MISPDPLVNFLNLLVGLIGGWTVTQGNRVWARGDAWAPVKGGLWYLAAVGVVCLLFLVLGLLHRIELGPCLMGGVLGALIGHAQGPRGC